MSKKSEVYTKISEAYAELAALEEVSTAKSPDSAADGVAGGSAGPKATKAAAAPAVVAKSAKPAKAKAPVITFEVLKLKLTELVNAKGKDAAREILSGFGAPKLVDLDEENFAEAHAQAVAAMAEEEAEPAADDDMFGE